MFVLLFVFCNQPSSLRCVSSHLSHTLLSVMSLSCLTFSYLISVFTLVSPTTSCSRLLACSLAMCIGRFLSLLW
jgi:hypothetical protein